MSSRPELKLDWCSAKAARYACEHWHYSRRYIGSKAIKIGAWEGGAFIGAIVFAWGGNRNIGRPYGLSQLECCELVRVALRAHEWPVSRMLAIACRMLRAQSPGMRLVVSYADPIEDHHGGIYQAGGWIYVGRSSSGFEFRMPDGTRLQKRLYTGMNYGRPAAEVPVMATRVRTPGKHKYLFPLDKAMREQVALLARPYPKRGPCAGSADSGTPTSQVGGGGANPTSALHPDDQ